MSQTHSTFANPDPWFWNRGKKNKKTSMYISTFMFIHIKLWGDALYVYCVDGKLQAIDEMFIYRFQWVEYMERLALGTAKVRDRRQLAAIVYTCDYLSKFYKITLNPTTNHAAFKYDLLKQPGGQSVICTYIPYSSHKQVRVYKDKLWTAFNDKTYSLLLVFLV